MTVSPRTTDDRTSIQKQSATIIQTAESEPNSALKCLHLLSVAGGATRKAYAAIANRVITDKDTVGAYHLALMAQSTPDLPIDAKALIEMVTEQGDIEHVLALLKNLPLPPIEQIKTRILASNDAAAITALNNHIDHNPDGYGTHLAFAGGQQDSIIPLSTIEPQ